jgi:murein L,D-transpeptidase YafK
LLSALALVMAYPLHAIGSADACRERGTTVLVLADAHRLKLCQDGSTVATHRVALGRGGVDKRREGDARTPLGTYPLGRPGRSSEFHRFIPVGYPTEAQRHAGYTGSAIGLHGPSRGVRRLGRLTTWVDWTAGCIAVGADGDIEEIASWVHRSRVRTITIE